MSVKPILFSTTMVQAILDGRKTMTRRAIKPQTVTHNTPGGMMVESLDDSMHRNKEDFELLVACAAQYQPGDILWVREKWRSVDFEYCDCVWSASIQYADGKIGTRVFWYDNSDVGIPDNCIYNKTGWRPSIHMPKEAARIFLRVTDVRAERLQEITEVDAKREGVDPVAGYCDGQPAPQYGKSYRLGFSLLWDHLNAKRGYGWGTNPWVWVYSFERVDKPEGWCK